MDTEIEVGQTWRLNSVLSTGIEGGKRTFCIGAIFRIQFTASAKEIVASLESGELTVLGRYHFTNDVLTLHSHADGSMVQSDPDQPYLPKYRRIRIITNKQGFLRTNTEEGYLEGWTVEACSLTVAELTEAVANSVMGWEKWISPNTLEWWVKDRLQIRVSSEWPIDDEVWRPATYATHRDMIVERMRELGYDWQIKGGAKAGLKYRANFCKEDFTKMAHAEDDNPGIAVMLAAYEAITGKRVEMAVD